MNTDMEDGAKGDAAYAGLEKTAEHFQEAMEESKTYSVPWTPTGTAPRVMGRDKG